MTDQQASVGDIPTRVFNDFLRTLEEKGVEGEVVARLKAELLVKKKYTERALRLAIFPTDS